MSRIQVTSQCMFLSYDISISFQTSTRFTCKTVHKCLYDNTCSMQQLLTATVLSLLLLMWGISSTNLAKVFIPYCGSLLTLIVAQCLQGLFHCVKFPLPLIYLASQTIWYCLTRKVIAKATDWNYHSTSATSTSCCCNYKINICNKIDLLNCFSVC